MAAATSPAGLRRRQLLAGLGALLAAAATGCTTAVRPRPPAAGPPPDVGLLAAAAARERALVSGYDSLLADRPRLTALLAPVRDQHLAHLAALTGPARPTAPVTGTTRSPGPSATGPASRPPPAGLVPAAPGTLAGLLAAETAAARAGLTGCLRARQRAHAQLLASIAASEASHVVPLRSAAGSVG